MIGYGDQLSMNDNVSMIRSATVNALVDTMIDVRKIIGSRSVRDKSIDTYLGFF